jgi:hypothetical protein
MFRPKKFLFYIKNKRRSWLTLMAMVSPALLLAATNAWAASGADAEQ